VDQPEWRYTDEDGKLQVSTDRHRLQAKTNKIMTSGQVINHLAAQRGPETVHAGNLLA
jgi:hypothetical protein